jgi:hypothetical protein
MPTKKLCFRPIEKVNPYFCNLNEKTVRYLFILEKKFFILMES